MHILPKITSLLQFLFLTWLKSMEPLSSDCVRGDADKKGKLVLLKTSSVTMSPGALDGSQVSLIFSKQFLFLCNRGKTNV